MRSKRDPNPKLPSVKQKVVVQRLEKGVTVKVVGPDAFPFVHTYIVVQPTKFWTSGSRMLATTTTLRLAEYHGNRRSYLVQHKYTGAWRLTAADKHMATEFDVAVIYLNQVHVGDIKGRQA